MGVHNEVDKGSTFTRYGQEYRVTNVFKNQNYAVVEDENGNIHRVDLSNPLFKNIEDFNESRKESIEKDIARQEEIKEKAEKESSDHKTQIEDFIRLIYKLFSKNDVSWASQLVGNAKKEYTELFAGLHNAKIQKIGADAEWFGANMSIFNDYLDMNKYC